MAENISRTASELIHLLELEMAGDISEIDVTSANEAQIDLVRVNEWYVETEKLIRVIGNQFAAPVSQAINQLRYAGHHILKVNISLDEIVKKQNTIEAFKHCKRAYYDALDFYTYKFAENYRVLLPLLKSEDASKLERTIREHLQDIQACRLASESRIEYYKGVQSTLIKGLETIEKLNEIQRASGVSQALFVGKRDLLEENSTLKKHLSALKSQVQQLNSQVDSKSYTIALIVTLAIAAATVAPPIINLFATNRHIVTLLSSGAKSEPLTPNGVDTTGKRL